MNLLGKVALITGASRGIGRAIAERLGEDGASIIVHYAEGADQAAETVSAIQASGGNAHALQADLSKLEDIRRLFRQSIDHFGKMDIFVQNPALFKPARILEVSEEDFDAAFALNAKGTFFGLQEAARRIQDHGRIIFISTCSTQMSLPGFSVYVGSKAAGEQFARALAHEVAERGITVNTVSPGFTVTDMLPKDPAWRKMGADMSVFKRLGQPDDIADVVAFLVSDQARWITGQNIQACGGVVM